MWALWTVWTRGQGVHGSTTGEERRGEGNSEDGSYCLIYQFRLNWSYDESAGVQNTVNHVDCYWSGVSGWVAACGGLSSTTSAGMINTAKLSFYHWLCKYPVTAKLSKLSSVNWIAGLCSFWARKMIYTYILCDLLIGIVCMIAWWWAWDRGGSGGGVYIHSTECLTGVPITRTCANWHQLQIWLWGK